MSSWHPSPMRSWLRSWCSWKRSHRAACGDARIRPRGAQNVDDSSWRRKARSTALSLFLSVEVVATCEPSPIARLHASISCEHPKLVIERLVDIRQPGDLQGRDAKRELEKTNE